jgi:hypothetical protein
MTHIYSNKIPFSSAHHIYSMEPTYPPSNPYISDKCRSSSIHSHPYKSSIQGPKVTSVVPSSRHRPQGSQSPHHLAPTETNSKLCPHLAPAMTNPTTGPNRTASTALAAAERHLEARTAPAAARRSTPATVEEVRRTAAWGSSGKVPSRAVEKDPVEGYHLESGSNPPTVPA